MSIVEVLQLAAWLGLGVFLVWLLLVVCSGINERRAPPRGKDRQ